MPPDNRQTAGGGAVGPGEDIEALRGSPGHSHCKQYGVRYQPERPFCDAARRARSTGQKGRSDWYLTPTKLWGRPVPTKAFQIPVSATLPIVTTAQVLDALRRIED